MHWGNRYRRFRPQAIIRAARLPSQGQSLAIMRAGVCNTHDAMPRVDHAIAGRWLATAAHARQPPPIRASYKAWHGNGAASEEGSGKRLGTGYSKASRSE